MIAMLNAVKRAVFDADADSARRPLPFKNALEGSLVVTRLHPAEAFPASWKIGALMIRKGPVRVL